MNLLVGFHIAIRAIVANRLRSALTALGLVIGVSSVIVLVAVGQGAQKNVIDRIQGLGTDLIFIQPGISDSQGAGPRGGFGSAVTLTADDADAIAEAELEGVVGVVSQINFNAQAIAGPNNLQVPIVGTTREYPTIRGLEVADGTFISNRDVDRKALSIVLGSLVAEPDFIVQSQEDLISASNDVTLVLSILLGSIAGISLVVGGIGVMNIMLVSVTERTREIGIRRALGARSKDIMTQFVIEALTLCISGGLLGIVVGVGVSMAVNGSQIGDQDVTTVVQAWSIVVAFAVAALVGLLNGSYPAYRAAQLDPIEALRME